MRSRFLRGMLLCSVITCLAAPATAQVTTFSADVNTAIDNGLSWLDSQGYFNGVSSGDATGLVTLALMEKRSSADQNAVGTGYSGATPADKAKLDTMVAYLINNAGNSFYSYRNGQEMMALALYLRTGGPDQAGALAALNAAFDESVNVIGGSGSWVQQPCTPDGNGWGGCAPGTGGNDASCFDYGSYYGYPYTWYCDPIYVFVPPPPVSAAQINSWHGYWCYSDINCEDASTTQFVVSGLAAARGVYSHPDHSDPTRLALLDLVTARTSARYSTGPGNQGCSPGGFPLSPNEFGAGYSPYNCSTFQQTGSGVWIQLVGGANLNSSGVQSFLRWLRNRYNYTDNNDNEWGNMSYGYGLWSTSKGLAFLDDGGLTPDAGNLSTADLGIADSNDHAGDPAPYGRRQLHMDPATAPRPVLFGPGGAGYYADPRELPRWYFDFAYTVISRQDGSGFFNSGSGWNQPSEQAYHILILQRSVGGGCLDADADGVCDADDNCPQVANAGQADADHDGLGDACDACPTDASNDADGDGVCGAVDNCPAVSNANQANADGDGQGDACDVCANDANNDADADGVCGDVDNCASVANSGQADGDSDGIGDACDACPTDASNDVDGDGFCGAVDNCPTVANANQVDSDRDGKGDACDACALDASNDADGDGACGNVDNCPSVANANQLDSDRDGVGDACDACALDASNDADGDGVCGNVDNCPAAANANQADSDGDGIGDVCDTINPPSCDDGSSDDHNPKHKHVHGKGHSSHGKGKGKGHDGKSCDDGSSDDKSGKGKGGKGKSDDKSGKGGKSVKPAPKPAPAPPPAPKPAPKKK